MVHDLYDIHVKEIIRETEDCVSVTLEVPAELKEAFHYQQGQYLTFEKLFEGESEPIRRSYSLCSAPAENSWKVAIKEVHNGKFSNFINKDLKVGEVLHVLQPDGRFFTKLDPSQQKQYVFFASGSGITPVISIIKEILFVEPGSTILLFYGNQRSDQIIFLEELMALKNLYSTQLSLHFILSREEMEETLFNGRIDKDKLLVFSKMFFQ